MLDNCGNCKYFRAQQIMGICRLNPQQVNHHENDWCGQHTAIEIKLVALPVYDITTDQTTQPTKRKYERKANAKASV